MLAKKKSKVSRMRGTSSHGWGHKKKHRGAGHRGGVGLSGTGAMGDAQKPGILANSKGILKKISAAKGIKMSKIKLGNTYNTKRGFASIHKKKQNVLSLNYLEHNYDKLVESGVIVEEKKEMIFDSTAFNYNKVLGRGKFTKKMTIVCFDISENAKQAVEAAGGKVVILGADEASEE